MAYRQTTKTEARRNQSRERFLRAARTLFADQGYQATTTREIVALAESSMGNLYFYFSDKEAVLRELVMDAMRMAEVRIDLAIALVQPVPPQLAIAIMSGVDSLLAESDLARIIFIEAPQTGLRREAIAHFGQRVHSFFDVNPSLSGGLPAEIAAACWVGSIWQAVEQHLLSPNQTDTRTLGQNLATWNLSALGIPPAIVRESIATASIVFDHIDRQEIQESPAMTKALTSEIEINASPTRVWEILTDFASYPEWNPFIKRISGSPTPGSRLEVRLHPLGGKAMTFKPKVLVATPEVEFRWLGNLLVPGLFDGEHRFTIEPLAGNRLRFVQAEQFTGILVGLLGSTLSHAEQGFHEMNSALKLRAEAADHG